MKRLSLIIGLILVFGISYAQKSLYDIEFGASIAETEEMLKDQGFQETGRMSTMITYKAKDIPEFISLELFMNDEQTSVARWRLQYKVSADMVVESAVLSQIHEIHGDYQVKDDLDYNYIWYFPTDKALYISTYADGRMVLSYSRGNWEEDKLDFSEEF